MREHEILNINKLDKLMETYDNRIAPWDYLDISPLQFCQYIIHSSAKPIFDKKQLVEALQEYDLENFKANKQFLDAVFDAS